MDYLVMITVPDLDAVNGTASVFSWMSVTPADPEDHALPTVAEIRTVFTAYARHLLYPESDPFRDFVEIDVCVLAAADLDPQTRKHPDLDARDNNLRIRVTKD